MSIRWKVSMMQSIKGTTVLAWVAASLLGLAGNQPAAQAQATPLAVVLQSKTLTTINGNAGHVAANTSGDAFYVSQTDNVLYWVKRGTTTPISLVSGLSGSRSAYVDSSNNVYVPVNYSGLIIEVPFVNGTYVTGSAKASLAACTSNKPLTPCTQFGGNAYWQATDMGIDGSGNAYLIDTYNGTDPAGLRVHNAIWKLTYNGVTYAAAVQIQGLPNNLNAQMTVDPAGDIFYADGSTLYYAAAGTATAVPFGIGLKAPSGVTLDKYGNLFVTDSSLNQIIEFPALKGVPQLTTQFVFSGTYSANGVGIDGLGDMYYTGYSGGTNLNVARINSFGLGTSAIGTAVSTTAISLTVNFTTAETLAAPTLAGASAGFSYVAGSCAVGTAYAAGGSCTIGVNYTPTAVGPQRGAVVLTNSSGAAIVTAELSGIGAGAAQTSDPGTASLIGSAYSAPQGIAVDSAKNVYIANTGKNTVVEYAAGSTTPVSLGSGLAGPTSVALDNAGNLYIADSGNGRVVEVPSLGGTLTTSAQSVILSGLGSSLGIATDIYGNLYVADSKNDKVMQLGPINGTPSTSASLTLTLPSTSVAPFALATDSVGNLFIADVTANTVTELAYYGKGLTSIGTGYSHPSGLAVDASGGLYVADPGNIRLIKIPFESPNYNTNDQYSVGPPFTVAAGVTIPYAVAIDASANLYVLDSQDATVTFLNRLQGTLNLGSSNAGSTTAQESAYIANAGNLSLGLGNPAYTATPNAAFTITAPSSNGCSNSQNLLVGFSCVLQATFKPSAVGSYSEALAFNSNASNTSSPSLTLTGQGLNVAATTLSLVQTSPTGTAKFGQTVVITANITSTTSGSFGGGDILVYIDGNFYSVVSVASGATSEAISVSGLLGGSHTVAASYTGNATYASSNSTLTLVVAQATTSVTVTGTGGQVYQFPTSAATGAPVTLTAIISVPASTVPTGTVTFTNGATTLGTATVTTINGVYQAGVTVTNLPAGTNTVAACYSGDINYGSSCSTLVVVISLQTFSLTPGTQTVTMGAAAAAVVPFQVESIAGFGVAYVQLNCSGLPANTACGFNPNGFVLQPGNLITAQQTNGAGTVVLVPAIYGPMMVGLNIVTGETPVQTPPTVSASLHVPGTGYSIPASWAFFAFAPLGLLLRRRIRSLRGASRLLTLVVLLGGSITAFNGCGSGVVGVTPPGTYQVTVTATATDPSYPSGLTTAQLASVGCTLTPGPTSATPATYPTCVQTAQITLVIH